MGKTCELLDEQHTVLTEHLKEIGPQQLYEQAKAEAAARREQVDTKAEKAREKHLAKAAANHEEPSADGGSTEPSSPA